MHTSFVSNVMKQPELFFIVGSPRSGTTLLQSICMCAEGVYVPPETHFLTRFPFDRPLKDDRHWEEALKEIEMISKRDEIPIKGLTTHAQTTPRTQSELLRLWLESSARAQQARWVGEASNVHTRELLTLAKMFPSAKIVHMIRDPRDVATSQHEAWGTSATRAALRWRDELMVHEQALSILNPTRYRAIFYEHLVTEPRAEIQALCAWFGWAYQDSMSTPHQRKQRGFSSRETHKLRTLKPITASRVGRWRTELSKDEVLRIELICCSMMTKLGYKRSTRPLRTVMQATPSLLSEIKEIGLSYGQRFAQQRFEMIERRLTTLHPSEETESKYP